MRRYRRYRHPLDAAAGTARRRNKKAAPVMGRLGAGGGCAVERTLQQLPHIHVQRVRQSQSIGEGDVAHLTLALLDALDLSFIDAGPR